MRGLLLLALLPACGLWVDTTCAPGIDRPDFGWVDADGDGFGGADYTCDGSGVEASSDCDDADPRVGAESYVDADADGYGVANGDGALCASSAVVSPNADDCDDDNPYFGARCPWSDLSAGVLHTCAIRTDASVECWGSDNYAQTTVPDDLDAVTAISAGGYHTCVLTTDGALECWGEFDLTTSETLDEAIPVGDDALGFTEVVSGITHACGVRDGGVVCWGKSGGPLGATADQIHPTVTNLSGLAAGFYHNCGLDADGGAHCWGYAGDRFRSADAASQIAAPAGTFAALAAGGFHTCGLGADGAITCWGNDEFGQVSDAPVGAGFVTLTAGGYHTCALDADGAATCWGRDAQGQTDVPDAEVFSEVVAGGYHTCGRRAGDAQVVCWGDDAWNQDRPPTYRDVAAGGDLTLAARPDGLTEWGDRAGRLEWRWEFEDVEVGMGHACALRAGRAVCWGLDIDGQATPADGLGTITRVSSGVSLPSYVSHTCAVSTDGVVSCWGDDTFGQLDVPAGSYVDVSVGGYHACAIDTDDQAVCWGATPADGNDDPLAEAVGQAVVPDTLVSKQVVEVSAGGLISCARLADHTVRCWGNDWAAPYTLPGDLATVTYDLITTGYQHACGVRTDSSVDCWTSGAATTHGDAAGEIPDGKYQDVTAGYAHTCGVLTSGEVLCWGTTNQYGELTVPEDLEDVEHVSAGALFTCAITTTGDIRCWGANVYGQAAVPSDPATEDLALAVGDGHACAVVQGGVVCAGADDAGQGSPLEMSGAVALAAGALHTCVLHDDASIECWGDDTYEQLDAPTGAFSALAAGGDHTCALDATAGIQCWGADDAGQSTPPEGTWSAVSAGVAQSCAIRDDDGALVCWGDDPAPVEVDGPWHSVVSGDWHTCALDSEGYATCWGTDTEGQVSETPGWIFTKLAAGAEHTCGLKPDEFVECWGRDLEGQSTAIAP